MVREIRLFLPVHISRSELQTSPVCIRIDGTRKENSGNLLPCHSLSPKVPSQSASSFHLSVSPSVNLLYFSQAFQLSEDGLEGRWFCRSKSYLLVFSFSFISLYILNIIYFILCVVYFCCEFFLLTLIHHGHYVSCNFRW
jgi:hypothetical protein